MDGKTVTYCGRCGKAGMTRRTMRRKGTDYVEAVYSCDNPNCDRAVSYVIMFDYDVYHAFCGLYRDLTKEEVGNIYEEFKI